MTDPQLQDLVVDLYESVPRTTIRGLAEELNDPTPHRETVGPWGWLW